MASTDAQKRASAKWTKKNNVTLAVQLNKEKDADIIAFLEGKNKSQTVKDAIRAIMN